MTLAEIIQNIETEIIATHWSVWIAIGTAIPYLILAAREKVACWYFGIISCIAWAYCAFFVYDLYVDALLQLFYVGISFLGIYQWKFGEKGKKELPITKMTLKEHGLTIGLGLVLTLIVGYFFATYTDAAATYIDSFTTVFSVLITFMVIQKKLDNWAYWIVIDTVYIYLYWTREGYFFSLLFVVYIIIVIIGWIEWQRKYNRYTKGAA